MPDRLVLMFCLFFPRLPRLYLLLFYFEVNEVRLVSLPLLWGWPRPPRKKYIFTYNTDEWGLVFVSGPWHTLENELVCAHSLAQWNLSGGGLKPYTCITVQTWYGWQNICLASLYTCKRAINAAIKSREKRFTPMLLGDSPSFKHLLLQKVALIASWASVLSLSQMGKKRVRKTSAWCLFSPPDYHRHLSYFLTEVSALMFLWPCTLRSAGLQTVVWGHHVCAATVHLAHI